MKQDKIMEELITSFEFVCEISGLNNTSRTTDNKVTAKKILKQFISQNFIPRSKAISRSEVKEFLKYIKKCKEAERNQGTYKYDFVYDDCIKILTNLLIELRK